MYRSFCALVVVALLSAACGAGPASSTAAVPPTASHQPPTHTAAPTSAPTATPADSGRERPSEAIAIEQPGPGSTAVSPLHIRGVADPAFENQLGVRLMSMDGQTIAEGSAQIEAPIGERGPFDASLGFTVSSEQPALLQVFDSSARDGGITHLNSVVVRLLPSGSADLQPAESGPERIQILAPKAGAAVTGGALTVRGFGVGSFESNLVVELLDANGEQLSMQPVIVDAPDMGQPGPFEVTLSYSVPSAQPGRVVVRDPSPAFGGAVHLASVEVQLQP